MMGEVRERRIQTSGVAHRSSGPTGRHLRRVELPASGATSEEGSHAVVGRAWALSELTSTSMTCRKTTARVGTHPLCTRLRPTRAAVKPFWTAQ